MIVGFPVGIGRFTTAILLLSVIECGAWRSAAANEVAEWNGIAFDVLIAGGQNNVTLTRGLTMVSVAMHDALNAISRRYETYVFDGAADPNAAPDAAVAPDAPWAWDARTVADAAFLRYLRDARDFAGGRRTEP